MIERINSRVVLTEATHFCMNTECTLRREQGSICFGNLHCLPGLVCGFGVCVLPSNGCMSDKECSDVPGTYCVSDSYQCKPFLQEGSRCNLFAICEPGLSCRALYENPVDTFCLLVPPGCRRTADCYEGGIIPTFSVQGPISPTHCFDYVCTPYKDQTEVCFTSSLRLYNNNKLDCCCCCWLISKQNKQPPILGLRRPSIMPWWTDVCGWQQRQHLHAARW